MQSTPAAQCGPAAAGRGAIRAAAAAQPPRAAAQAGRRAVVPKALGVDEASNGAGKSETSALDFDELTELIRMVHATDIVELELNAKKFKLSVKKREALEAAEPQVVHVQQQLAPAGYALPPPPPPAAAPAAAPAPAAAAPAPAPAAAAAAPAAVDGVEVLSPMAGTMYRSPAPGEPAFIQVGDRVAKGQTICIIEAMKLMNEIEAEVGGTVVQIVAENGKPVVPGQCLVIIKP